MRYMRIVNEIKLSQVVGPKHKDSIEFVQKWKSGEKIPNPKFQQIKTDVSRAFDIATNSTKLKGANEFTVWGLQKQDGETEEYKYSFPNSVLHVAGYLKRTTKQLKRTIKSPNATKLVKAAMTACEPWVEIAEKLKAMKGDVVKRQVGVGTKKNPVPTGVLNKEIEEELKETKKIMETKAPDGFVDEFSAVQASVSQAASIVGGLSCALKESAREVGETLRDIHGSPGPAKDAEESDTMSPEGGVSHDAKEQSLKKKKSQGKGKN